MNELQHGLQSAHLPALDGLRAVAVFLVIFYHLDLPYIPGGYGVVLFFVISGFLITWLLLKEFDRTGDISLRSFYRRRVLRIFPAYYVFLFGWIAILIVANRPVPWAHAGSAFLFVSNYYNAIFGDPNNGFSHTWSLGIEEQFYLLWPTTLILLLRFPNRLPIVMGAAIVLVWIYRAVLCFAFDVDQRYLYAAFDTRCDALFVGCLLAVVLRRGLWAPLVNAVTANPWLPLFTWLALVIAIYFPEISGVAVPRYRDVFGFLLVPPLMAILIAQMIAHSRHWLWGWLEVKPVVYLGTISYSLYLYQQVVMGPVEKFFRNWPSPVALCAAVVATIIVASGSYYFVERPFLRLKDSK